MQRTPVRPQLPQAPVPTQAPQPTQASEMNMNDFQNATMDTPFTQNNGGEDSQRHTQANSPTPTEESLEEIRERTRLMEESLRQKTEVKRPPPVEQQEGENIPCRDRHHEFQLRTQKYLAVPAKRLIKVAHNLLFQLNREKWGDEISQQYGDELLKEVQMLYSQVEDVREYCLEPLTEDEQLQKSPWLEEKFELLCMCERVYKKYFEQQEENKRLRQQYQQQKMQQAQSQRQMPPPAPNTSPSMSTPFPQHPKPPFRPPFDQDQSQQGQQQQNQDKGHHDHSQQRQQPGFNDNGQQGAHYDQSQKGAPGFNIFEDQGHGSRIPTGPSVTETHHHPRYKMHEELALVEKWDGSKPRDYMAFRTQWSNFYEKMAVKEQRSSLDLYYSLLKVLGGSARELAETKYPNDQSYAQAIKKLDDLFFNPANLLRDMIQNLLKGQKMFDTYDSLFSGLNQLIKAWDDLDQADLTKDQLKGLLFIAASEKNLSEESWKCWIDVQNDPKNKQNPMEAFEISTYLESIKKAMLNAQKRKNAIGSSSRENNSRTPAKPGKKQSTLFGAYSNTVQSNSQSKSSTQSNAKVQQQARGPNNTCITCGQTPHRFQLNCPKLKEMTADQIYKTMTNFRIQCQMCLGLGHRTKDCSDSRAGRLTPCSVKEDGRQCKMYHCRYLHKYRNSKEEPKETPPPKQE